MKLGELMWKEYTDGVHRKILVLARRIIRKEIEELTKFSESSEYWQTKFQKEVKDLYKIVEVLEGSLASGMPLSLDISELGPESESIIKRAIAEAARRLRPIDQKGILEALQPKGIDKSQTRKESIRSETFSKRGEEKIDELLHSGMLTPLGEILEISNRLLDEIHEIRTLFERIGGFK